MNVAIFNVHRWEKEYLTRANDGKHRLNLLDTYLTLNTAELAKGSEALSIFTEDDASAPVLERLHELGIRFIALRSAGYNNIDIARAQALGIRVARVPEYSPHAIAEFAVGVMLALNRKLIRTHYRIMRIAS